MRRIVAPLVLVLASAAAAAAGDLHLDPALTPGEFDELTVHLAEGIAMPSAPSKPLGTAGFELRLLATWVDADSGASWWHHSMSGLSETLGGLGSAALVGRVGLPWGIDLGGQIGAIAGETYWSAELRKSLLEEHGAVPSIGLTASWSTMAGGPVDLDVASLGLGVSKRLAVVTPYAAVAYRWRQADASWGAPEPAHHHVDGSTAHVAAGVHLSLPVLGFRFELRHGDVTAAYLGIGIGL